MNNTKPAAQRRRPTRHQPRFILEITREACMEMIAQAHGFPYLDGQPDPDHNYKAATVSKRRRVGARPTAAPCLAQDITTN